MKSFLKISTIVILTFGIIPILLYCKKKYTIPVVTTSEVSNISLTSAYSGGNVIDDGGDESTHHGVCWSTSQNPTIASYSTTDGIGTGEFQSFIFGLSPNTTYYTRAYASNSAGSAYGEQIQFTTAVDLTGETGAISDIEGNTYLTIGVGSQIWMAENLKTTKFNDGSSIALVADSSEWVNLATPGYCLYNDSSDYKLTYGVLYNGFAVQNDNLCPTGWHVPTWYNWDILVTDLGGEAIGSRLKEAGTTHWQSPNNDATNETGFTALPGGFRYYGRYDYLGKRGVWWTSTEILDDPRSLYIVWIKYDDVSLLPTGSFKESGLSVRCVKDN